MTERGMSLRRLAKAASYDPSYLSKVLSGHKPSSPYLAARLDDALGAGGAIRDAAQQPLPRPTRKASAPGRKPSGAVEALQVAMAGDPAGPDIGADGLAELVQHYAHTLAVAPSPAVYGELLSARSFAGTLLGRSAPRQRPDLMVTAGLAVQPAGDLGGGPRRPRGGGHLVCRYRTAWPGRLLPRPARLGGADPVADRLVPGRPAGLGGRRPARPGRRAARTRSRTPSSPPRRCAAGRCSAMPPGWPTPGAVPPPRWLSSARRPGGQRVLGPAGRGPAVHRDLAAAGGPVRRGGADDAADHRCGLPPAGAGTVGPADQLRPDAADPRACRRRARRPRPGRRPPGPQPWTAAGSCGRRWCWPASSTKSLARQFPRVSVCS